MAKKNEEQASPSKLGAAECRVRAGDAAQRRASLAQHAQDLNSTPRARRLKQIARLGSQDCWASSNSVGSGKRVLLADHTGYS